MRELLTQVVRATAFDESWNVRWPRVGIRAEEQVDMIGLDRQPNDLPVMFSRYLSNDLLQTVMHQADQHRPASLRTPDDVVHDEVYAVLFMCVVQVGMMPQNNTVCKARGPFIPRLKTGGFLAHFL